MLFKAPWPIFAPRTKQFERKDEQSDGAVAQLVEQRTENPCVPGSSPGGATKKPSMIVEGFLYKGIMMIIYFLSLILTPQSQQL